MTRVAVAAVALVVCLAGCSLPYSLGQPTTRSLESQATDALGPHATFALHGTYTAQGSAWTLAMVFVRPDREDLQVTGRSGQVEAMVVGDQAYFRGQAFLAAHMGTDPQALALVHAAGNAWWKGSTALLPAMPDLTTGSAFRTTFLGAAVTSRTDNVTMDGLLTVELSGPRADVYIRQDEPHYLVRLRMKEGVSVDGLIVADLTYTNFNSPLEISPPTDVIDFSNLTTLPPIYTVVSVDTSKCLTSCVVSAVVKNLGGLNGARAPSTVTFKLTDAGTLLGSCATPVAPDVGYNTTTTVSCTIDYSGQLDSGSTVTATADNPGRA